MNVDLIAHLDAANTMYVRDGDWVSIPTNMGFVRADLQTRRWSVGERGVEHIGLQKLINLLEGVYP